MVIGDVNDEDDVGYLKLIDLTISRAFPLKVKSPKNIKCKIIKEMRGI